MVVFWVFLLAGAKAFLMFLKGIIWKSLGKPGLSLKLYTWVIFWRVFLNKIVTFLSFYY